MQGQTNPSLFDSIFNFIAPAKVVEEISLRTPKKTVYDIFWDNMTDFVEVRMDCINSDGEDDPDTLYIKHDDLRQWLKDTNRLDFYTGSNHMEGGDIVEGEESMEIGYVDYIDDHMTAKDIAAFITFKKLQYEFDSSI